MFDSHEQHSVADMHRKVKHTGMVLLYSISKQMEATPVEFEKEPLSRRKNRGGGPVA